MSRIKKEKMSEKEALFHASLIDDIDNKMLKLLEQKRELQRRLEQNNYAFIKNTESYTLLTIKEKKFPFSEANKMIEEFEKEIGIKKVEAFKNRLVSVLEKSKYT